MIKDTKNRTKHIKDPLFSSIKLWMEERIAFLQREGREEDLKLAKTRYTGLTNKDVQIEPPKKFPNGKILSCFISRKNGFFHADAEIKTVLFPVILKDQQVAAVQYNKNELETKLIDKIIDFGLFYLGDTKEHVIVLNSEQNDINAVYNALGKIHWDKLSINLTTTDNSPEERAGTVTVECINLESSIVIPVYYVTKIKKK